MFKLFFKATVQANDQIEKLKAIISNQICAMLGSRINALKDVGIVGIWLKAEGTDFFNAGTILGYSEVDWDIIKKYSGLWTSGGNIQKEEIWNKKLIGISNIRRKYRAVSQSTQSLWFKFYFSDEVEMLSDCCTPGFIS